MPFCFAPCSLLPLFSGLALSAALPYGRWLHKRVCGFRGALFAARAASLVPYDLGHCLAGGQDSYVWEARRRGAPPGAGKVALKLEYQHDPEKTELHGVEDAVASCRRMHFVSQLLPAHHVDCYEVGSLGGGFSWYALGFVRGQSLKDFNFHNDIRQRPPQLASVRGTLALVLRVFDAMDAMMPLKVPPFRYYNLDVHIGNVMLDPKDGAISFVDADKHVGCHDAGRETSQSDVFPSCAAIAPVQFCRWHVHLTWTLFHLFLQILTWQDSVPVRGGASENSQIMRWWLRIYDSKTKSLGWCNRTLAASDAKPKLLLHASVADPTTAEFVRAVESFVPDLYWKEWQRAMPLGLERAFLSAQSIAWPPLFIEDFRRAWTGLGETAT